MIPTTGIPSWLIAYFGKKKLRLLNIKRIPLSRTGGKDRKFWHYSKSGRFTFSSSVVIFIVALVGVKTKSGKNLGASTFPEKWSIFYGDFATTLCHTRKSPTARLGSGQHLSQMFRKPRRTFSTYYFNVLHLFKFGYCLFTLTAYLLDTRLLVLLFGSKNWFDHGEICNFSYIFC
mgnify:CR=1 FL=1